MDKNGSSPADLHEPIRRPGVPGVYQLEPGGEAHHYAIRLRAVNYRYVFDAYKSY